MVHRVGGRQNYAASRRKGQSHQSMPGDFETSFALWRDFHNAAIARERSRDIEVAVRVESHALRASQAAEKLVYRPVRIDSLHTIKARSRGSSYKQIPL